MRTQRHKKLWGNINGAAGRSESVKAVIIAAWLEDKMCCKQVCLNLACLFEPAPLRAGRGLDLEKKITHSLTVFTYLFSSERELRKRCRFWTTLRLDFRWGIFLIFCNSIPNVKKVWWVTHDIPAPEKNRSTLAWQWISQDRTVGNKSTAKKKSLVFFLSAFV